MAPPGGRRHCTGGRISTAPVWDCSAGGFCWTGGRGLTQLGWRSIVALRRMVRRGSPWSRVRWTPWLTTKNERVRGPKWKSELPMTEPYNRPSDTGIHQKVEGPNSSSPEGPPPSAYPSTMVGTRLVGPAAEEAGSSPVGRPFFFHHGGPSTGRNPVPSRFHPSSIIAVPEPVPIRSVGGSCALMLLAVWDSRGRRGDRAPGGLFLCYIVEPWGTALGNRPRWVFVVLVLRFVVSRGARSRV